MVPWMSGLVNGLQNRLRRFESARHLANGEDLTKERLKGAQPNWLAPFSCVLLCPIAPSPPPQSLASSCVNE